MGVSTFLSIPCPGLGFVTRLPDAADQRNAVHAKSHSKALLKIAGVDSSKNLVQKLRGNLAV